LSRLCIPPDWSGRLAAGFFVSKQQGALIAAKGAAGGNVKCRLYKSMFYRHFPSISYFLSHFFQKAA
jgi:hypothetical protein